MISTIVSSTLKLKSICTNTRKANNINKGKECVTLPLLHLVVKNTYLQVPVKESKNSLFISLQDFQLITKEYIELNLAKSVFFVARSYYQ